MGEVQEQIWHCPYQPDRELADILVGQAMPWKKLAAHFRKPYPYSLVDKYDLVYRLLGCKKDKLASTLGGVFPGKYLQQRAC